MDIGDIVGIKGYPFKTKTGEMSIHATEVTLTYQRVCRFYLKSIMVLQTQT